MGFMLTASSFLYDSKYSTFRFGKVNFVVYSWKVTVNQIVIFVLTLHLQQAAS